MAFIWGSTRDYHDRHYYGCWFPVKPGELFEFAGEMTRAYFGTRLSVDVQVALWEAMQAQRCDKMVDVCETRNHRISHRGFLTDTKSVSDEGQNVGVAMRRPDLPAMTSANSALMRTGHGGFFCRHVQCPLQNSGLV